MSALRPFLFILLCAAAPGALSKTNQIGDLCVPNPCQNGGVCSAINGSTVLCDCSQGFTGAQCQWRTTQCKDNPCKHGICQLDQNNSPQCFCVPGYTGKYCENNHNECASQPCRNGATCIDEVNDFRCICEAGSFGRHCEMLDEHIKDFVRRCDDGSICWRNGSIQTSTSWGYGDGICSTQHSCFGGQNDSSTNTFDRLIDVQLKPLQIQIGDSMNFTADEEMASSSDGFQVYRAFDEDSSGFRTCNETDGKLISQEPQESVLVGPDILTPGLNYFYVNLDTIFRCEFGLRLNVSVKGNHCYNSSSDGSELCSGRGQCHTNFSLPDYRCKCCDGFRGEYCEKLDHCFPKPCKNGAECKNIDGDPGNGEPYVCVCRPGYEGRDCSIITDKCLSSPCRNGAQCVPKVNDFSCVCPHGYTGKTCAVDINECDSNPCQNGATCQDALSSYSCTCKPGFAGSVCEVNINECKPDPCKHGTCIDEINGYKCHCQPGYGGIECAFNLNECLSNPCKNGGFCVDEVNGYRCDCGVGYKGSHCEHDIDLCKDPVMCSNAASCTDKGNSVSCVCKPGFTGANCAVNINDCASTPCLNGATCVDKENAVECRCLQGFTGKFCQDIVYITSVMTHRTLALKLLSECQILQDRQVLTDMKQNLVSEMAKACNCSFTEQEFVQHSFTLKCYDSISAKVGVDIKAVGTTSKERLVCLFANHLKQHRNAVDLGHNIFAVKVLSDTSSCHSNVDKPQSADDDQVMSQGNIAVTVSAVVAAVGLILAAVVVCLKCRRARPPVKKQKSRNEDDMIDNLSLDLMTAVAPTPKSMYRTSGGYHNMGFNAGRFNPENPVKSRKV